MTLEIGQAIFAIENPTEENPNFVYGGIVEISGDVITIARTVTGRKMKWRREDINDTKKCLIEGRNAINFKPE